MTSLRILSYGVTADLQTGPILTLFYAVAHDSGFTLGSNPLQLTRSQYVLMTVYALVTERATTAEIVHIAYRRLICTWRQSMNAGRIEYIRTSPEWLKEDAYN